MDQNTTGGLRFSAPQEPTSVNVGGIMEIKSLQQTLDERDKESAAAAAVTNSTPLIQSLAAQIRDHWTQAKMAKQSVELRIMDALRSKRGEYHPDKLRKIRESGGSEIYMMLFNTKARQAKSLWGDILLGQGVDKPFTVKPTPSPQLPPEITMQIKQGAEQLVAQAEMSGLPMSIDDIRQLLRDAKDRAQSAIDQEASDRAKRAERKIEDMLVEGGFFEALDQFLDDLCISPTAFLKGPVVRKRGTLAWTRRADGTSVPTATYENAPHWERVDPLYAYPSGHSRTVHDGFFIERHRLSYGCVSELQDLPGYNKDAIKEVMKAYTNGGLHEWLSIDSARAVIENPSATIHSHTSDTIDALQYWGAVTGKKLIEWGLTAEQVPDESKVYEVEAWLIGNWVIKADINQDPLARRPYYTDSFDRVPGALWGNSLYDTMRDCEDMCNAAARALANNMGIASGPQVWVMVDRMPAGANISELYPWKIHQVLSDPSGSTAQPMGFFQPTSNAQELMAVFDRYSILADEVTGIPRYMTGDGAAGGAGRTASGMSMMIGNAGKTTKKTIASIDMRVISPVVEGAYGYIMRYVGDPDIKGDLKIEACGALSLMVKDSAQVHRAEFLRNTANPFDMQIMGVDGRAAVLREAARTLDMNVDDVVPSLSIIRQRMAMQQMQAQQQAMQDSAAQEAQTSQKQGGKQLMNKEPVTENLTPQG